MSNRLLHRWHAATVTDSVAVSSRVRRIVFDIPSAGASVGSHIDFEIPSAEGPRIRSYSIITDGRYAENISVAVQLEPNSRGGSRWMHSLRPGDEVTVSQPFSSFELSTGTAHRVLMAGGIGITPLLGMARALRDRESSYELIYLGRTVENMPFVNELKTDHGDRLRVVESSRARVDLDRMISAMDTGTELYVCGSARLLSAVQSAWSAHARPVQALRFETFGSTASADAPPFELRVPGAGLTIKVPPDKTMLESLESAGCEVLSDCLRGQCGLCAVDVLECNGGLDHRDVFLSPRQKLRNDRIVLCVSRSAGGAVTIDLP
jgi:ferredoxin-NADP reductase